MLMKTIVHGMLLLLLPVWYWSGFVLRAYLCLSLDFSRHRGCEVQIVVVGGGGGDSGGGGVVAIAVVDVTVDVAQGQSIVTYRML